TDSISFTRIHDAILVGICYPAIQRNGDQTANQFGCRSANGKSGGTGIPIRASVDDKERISESPTVWFTIFPPIVGRSDRGSCANLLGKGRIRGFEVKISEIIGFIEIDAIRINLIAAAIGS